MSKSSFFQEVREHKFAASSKAAKILKSGGTDIELAAAVKTTKAYKESKSLQSAVAEVEKAEIAENRTEKKAPVASSRAGEPRSY